jgi:putative ABC transport system permease protein
MRPIPIQFSDVVVSLLFVAVAVLAARWERTGEERPITWAAARAILQLLAVGYVINAVFGLKHLAATAAFIGVMLAFATQIAARRGAGVPGSTRVAATAISAGAGAVLMSLVALQIVPAKPQYLIPLAGMLVGNSMSSCGIALREIGRDRIRAAAELETALSLGAEPRVASRDARRRTMRAALGPLIDSTKAVGIVSLPGAMTGMILAGVSPLQAVRLQIVVMFMLLAATSLTVLLAVELGTARLFNTRAQLVPAAHTSGPASPTGAGAT